MNLINAIYEKYLTDVITPKIPVGATVIIHGHTDAIGEETYNQNLSLARANDVKNIIENSLSKAGRNDVKFELNGFGEMKTNLLLKIKLKNDLTIERL
jgi:outer membrane protein OmpA-like peptidoglycan-associated protein